MRTINSLVAITACIGLAGCASTDVQPLTATSFMVSTTAASACGPSGARKVANQAAAIEVIKRGGDRFIFVSQNSDSRITGGNVDTFGNVQVYRSNDQGLVVQMIGKGQAGYNNSLSARQILGPEWQATVAEGVPKTCT